MAFFTGTGSSLQIGKESSFGTAALPTTLVDITSESIKVSVEKGDEGSLLSSKTPMNRDLLGISVEGSASCILRPEFAGLLLHAAMGGSDLCEQIDESGVYTHTLNLCNVHEDLPGLTVVVDRKAAVKQYAGCTISSLSIDCAAGDYVKASIDLKGTQEEPGSLNESLSGFSVPSYRCTAATFTIAGTSYDISSASIKIDNALEAAPKTYASGLLSGRPQHGKRSATLSVEIPYSAQVEALKSTYLTTETTASVALSFSSSAPHHTITITISHMSVSDVDATVSGTGILSSSIAGEALSVGTDEPITVVITDTISTPYGG